MSNVIKGNFKNHRTEYPSRFFCGWIPSVVCTSEEYQLYTSHLKFRVYETAKNYAFQFSIGQGGEGSERPYSFYDASPVYNKSLEKLWEGIFSRLESRNVDVKLVREKIREFSIKQNEQKQISN
jgi:hypothetical protein